MYNSSHDPNVALERRPGGLFRYVALQPVSAGEELLINYPQGPAGPPADRHVPGCFVCFPLGCISCCLHSGKVGRIGLLPMVCTGGTTRLTSTCSTTDRSRILTFECTSFPSVTPS
eukprot:EG_transcript_30846